jgi:hypothetical protein
MLLPLERTISLLETNLNNAKIADIFLTAIVKNLLLEFSSLKTCKFTGEYGSI